MDSPWALIVAFYALPMDILLHAKSVPDALAMAWFGALLYSATVWIAWRLMRAFCHDVGQVVSHFYGDTWRARYRLGMFFRG